jgi:hypothetical protein
MATITILVLSACADWPETREELWDKPAGRKVFSTPIDYQAAYKIIFVNASKCFSKGDYRTSGTLDSAQQQGIITIGLYSREFGATVLMDVIVTPRETGSQISVAHAAQEWERRAELPDAWVSKGSSGCQ